MKRNLKNAGNFYLLWTRDIFITAFSSLTATSVLSAFFLHIGLSESQIGIYIAAVPMVNLVFSLLFSGITERYTDTVRGYTKFCLLSAPVAAAFLIFCFLTKPLSLVFAGIMIIGMLLSAVGAVRTIFDYKLPCEVMDLADYPVYVSMSGIIQGITGILTGLAVSFCYRTLPFLPVTAVIFPLAGLFLFTAALLNARLTVVNPTETMPKKGGGNPITVISGLLRDRDFLHLAPANFIRGFGAGIVSMVPVLAAKKLDFDEGQLSFINVCVYLGTLGSCLVYAAVAKRFGAEKSGLLGGAVFCISVFCFFGGTVPFYILYTVSYVGYNIMCCAIPNSVYYHIAPSKISTFQTWRLALTTLGTTLSAAVTGAYMGKVPVTVWMLIASLSVGYCVITYAHWFAKRDRTA